jgi:hypothetical protein
MCVLLPNESAALVEVLRRDIEGEQQKAMLYPKWADYHLQNARLSIRILEALGYKIERYGLDESIRAT